MSQQSKWSYEMAEEIRRQQRLARMKEATKALCAHQCDGYGHEGLDQFLPEEFDRVQQELERIRARVEKDPEAAQAASMKLAAEVSRLAALAREAQKEFDARYRQQLQELRQQQTQARSSVAALVNEQLMSLRDPVLRDFAHDELHALQQEYEQRTVTPEELRTEQATVKDRIDAVLAAAKQEALEWKRQKAEAMRAQAQQELLKTHRAELARSVDENPKAIHALLADLDALEERLSDTGALADEDFQEAVEQTVARSDEAVVDERCRKETVKAVLKSLRASGFVVDTPRRQKEGDSDEVVVLARKPAGQQAEFRVNLDGGFLYRFDRYEGLTCKKDLDRILPMLQDIYGVKLSDRRVLWENPVPESRTARPLKPGTEVQHHGC